MSLNVFCELRKDSFTVVERPVLVQLSSRVSESIVFVEGDPRKGRRPWRESARLYLEEIARMWASKPNTIPAHLLRGNRAQRQAAAAAKGPRSDYSYDDAIVRRERKKIGEAWRMAEEMENGSLFFGVS